MELCEEAIATETVSQIVSDKAFLEADQACLRYEGTPEDALSDISLKMNKGDIVGIIGGTGSGKSSLVQMLQGLYALRKGEIYFSGEKIDPFAGEHLRRRIGYVPQKAVLFQGTLRENLLWGNPDATDEELLQALRNAQFSDVVEKKEGLDTDVEQGGGNFSGGQKQRISIARALVREPELLILDDSTSALDLATEAELRKVLLTLPYKPLMLLVSQRVSFLSHTDRILVLEDGRIVGDGVHNELLKNCTVYRELAKSQGVGGIENER